jgi:hypothetical protein
MTKLLLVPALLFTACGDNLHPDEDQITAGAEEDTNDTPNTPDAPDSDASLFAFFLQFPSQCIDHSVILEGHSGYTDGTPLDNPICRYDFADGTSVDSCGAFRSFPASEVVVFTVTDPATGQVARHEEGVIGPRTLDVTLDVASNGMSISWDALGTYGDSPIDVMIEIEPADKVIVDDPTVFFRSTGTVRVTSTGTYTVTASTRVQFGEHGGCFDSIERRVDVICNDNMHTH